MKLTVMQKKFADEYIRTGNGLQSAIKAGYSERSAKEIASETLTKPNVKAYVEKRMKELEKDTIADADEVLQYLTRVMRGEIDEPTLKGVGKGEQELIYTEPQINDRTRAAELIGRRYAIFTDKLELDGDLGVNIIDDIPEGELDD